MHAAATREMNLTDVSIVTLSTHTSEACVPVIGSFRLERIDFKIVIKHRGSEGRKRPEDALIANRSDS